MLIFYMAQRGRKAPAERRFWEKKRENESKNLLDNHFQKGVTCICKLNIQRKIRWEMWKMLLSKVEAFTLKSERREFLNVEIRIFHIIHKVFHTLKVQTFTEVFNALLGKTRVIFIL